MNQLSKDNIEYDRLSKALLETDLSKKEDIMKQILGYNKIGKISTLKKAFLTNNLYFYDLNRIITHIGTLNYSYNDCANSPADFDFDLSCKTIDNIIQNWKC